MLPTFDPIQLHYMDKRRTETFLKLSLFKKKWIHYSLKTIDCIKDGQCDATSFHCNELMKMSLYLFTWRGRGL